MFYVKTEYQGRQIEIDIYGDEIFTRCYKCGKEIQIDEELMLWVLQDGGSICSTSLSCGCNYEKTTLIRIK